MLVGSTLFLPYRLMAGGTITCGQFTDFLIRKTEHLDDEIVRAIRPTDQWVAHVDTGVFPALDGVSHTFDRIERVIPDLTGAWANVTASGCVGAACDKTEKAIGFGSTRDSYQLKEKSYKTDLFCVDLILSSDRAKEQFREIINNLKEASVWINSDWLRIEALRIAQKKWVASTSMQDFTYSWNSDYTQLTVLTGGLPTSKLTPNMLQRRVQPQISQGAMGERPVGTPMLLELVTDMDTLYAMEQGNSTLNALWRFMDWSDEPAQKFYQLGWAGKIGNYAVRVDLFPMRFEQLNGAGNTLVRVFPFIAVAATSGIKSIPNPDFDTATYQISFIHHRKAMRRLVRDTTDINPMMPFLKRDFAGKWMFVMDNLGADANGCVIENKRRNKGQFIADFAFATKAAHPEWEEAILHLREPGCVAAITLCNPGAATSYDPQSYGAANSVCIRTFVFTPVKDSNNNYQVAANTITCNGQAISHIIILQAQLPSLVAALNSVAGSLGTWSIVDGSTTQIQLAGTTCTRCDVPFVVS